MEKKSAAEINKAWQKVEKACRRYQNGPIQHRHENMAKFKEAIGEWQMACYGRTFTVQERCKELTQ